jgi:hypothetical protein
MHSSDKSYNTLRFLEQKSHASMSTAFFLRSASLGTALKAAHMPLDPAGQNHPIPYG